VESLSRRFPEETSSCNCKSRSSLRITLLATAMKMVLVATRMSSLSYTICMSVRITSSTREMGFTAASYPR
jgi:hypothetical protein